MENKKPNKIGKILIANRGEIACRIIRTCKNLGIRTAAIYSTEEKSSLHVTMADEAYPLPEYNSPTSGYLDIARLLSICEKANVHAIHPGYGFLSENPNLAQACSEAEIIFIGPPAGVIKAMANKREARRKLHDLGVPILSGSLDRVNNLPNLEAQAKTIGYPIIVKASEGGGGIGLGIVDCPQNLNSVLRRARSTATRTFGSDDLYLEKFIPDARHIEVQVLGDHYGNIVHLFERECSVQRRHQKLIEETPAPQFSKNQQTTLFKSAIDAARGIGYQNAGTLEFLLAPDESFYFIEANTRLQVEHGITEMVTGIDLVEQQIHIATGEPLGFSQNEIETRGHSIEVRIYAEDPVSFVPSPGWLTEWEIPSDEFIRVESGVRSGDEITSYFDPLIAKILVHAADRRTATEKLLASLVSARINGILTNVPFLIKALQSSEFKAGTYTTQLAAQLTTKSS